MNHEGHSLNGATGGLAARNRVHSVKSFPIICVVVRVKVRAPREEYEIASAATPPPRGAVPAST